MGDLVGAFRRLLIVADDYGIGPATSRGILDLGLEGHLSAAVLLVNTPYAEVAVHQWRQQGRPMALGWHPNLTLDAPIMPGRHVRSLVSPAGTLWPLNQFLARLGQGLIRAEDVLAELAAQHQRFYELVGHVPHIVNSHQHVQIFPPIGPLLLSVLAHHAQKPYVRRVQEPWSMLGAIPGATIKRTLLTVFGRVHARTQQLRGFPGNEWLAGITNPINVVDPEFLTRWISRIPGSFVELACHPGHHDPTLVGRDVPNEREHLARRIHEFQLLRHPSFAAACQRAGFRPIMADELLAQYPWEQRHAA